MAQILDPLPAGPTTLAEIKAFEDRVGHKLPSDYRSFLLKHNGGHPSPNAFTFDAGRGEEEDIVLCFFPMRDVTLGNVDVVDLAGLRTWPVHCAWDDLHSDLANLSGSQFEALLPIGTDGSGNYVCLVLDGEQTGSIVFLDHETADVTWLAANLDTFLTSLKSRKRPDATVDSSPVVPDRTYDKIAALNTAGACVPCGGSGQCYCLRKGTGDPVGCMRCHGTGKCGGCAGSGKARR